MNLSQQDPDPAIRQWATSLLSSLRVVMPLYNEEVYFLVQKDSPIHSVMDIEGKRLSIGPEGSGTNLTAKNIYFKLFGKAPNVVQPFIEPGVSGEDEGTKIRRSALWRLAHPELGPDDRKVDVFVLVDGQPVELLAKLGSNFRLLTVNGKDPKIQSLLTDYKIGTLLKKNYAFLTQDEPVLSVPSYLITAHFKNAQRSQYLNQFAVNFCEHFSDLYNSGHSKWQTLDWSPRNSALPEIGTGWVYSEETKPILENCKKSFVPVENRNPLTCSIEDRAIGLCQ